MIWRSLILVTWTYLWMHFLVWMRRITAYGRKTFHYPVSFSFHFSFSFFHVHILPGPFTSSCFEGSLQTQWCIISILTLISLVSETKQQIQSKYAALKFCSEQRKNIKCGLITIDHVSSRYEHQKLFHTGSGSSSSLVLYICHPIHFFQYVYVLWTPEQNP